MQIRTLPDARAVALAAADAIAAVVRDKPGAMLALPTGKTPIATYAELQRRFGAGAVDLSRTTVWAVDEFAGPTRATPGTNSVFYRTHLGVPLRALHIPNPSAQDPDEHIAAFAAAIARSGGLDLCVLGIGTNGHIAFNEPPSGADAPARVVTLSPSSREAHAESFGGLERVPPRAMTLGVADLLAARRILVLATGAHKAAIVRRAIEDSPTADVPASWLQQHPDCAWLLDAAAATDLR
ncbi:MAG TPA: glucosamine-6-phosphate deaminase [Dehalococcoidia bacterium]|nr:glucosamine-6-phosphate deaminase [Dehalococcoidia bacterium]